MILGLLENGGLKTRTTCKNFLVPSQISFSFSTSCTPTKTQKFCIRIMLAEFSSGKKGAMLVGDEEVRKIFLWMVIYPEAVQSQ